MIRRGDLRVELLEVPGAAPLPPARRVPNEDLKTHGSKHLAFAIPNVDAAEKELRELDVDIGFVGRFRFGSNIFLRDNAGKLIELVEEPSLWNGAGDGR